MTLKLAVFDVDGTLVDSQAEILGAMHAAFSAQELAAPTREAILGIVGLSLPEAMARLMPDAAPQRRAALVEGYKSAYAANRLEGNTGPLYPGIRALLDRLVKHDGLLMGVATGKSRRGLTGLVAHHDLDGYFVTLQCADDHPSKPHPSMLWQALRDAGVEAHEAVMIGDTSYDIDMGQAASMATIAVDWGYHDSAAFAHAGAIVSSADALEQQIYDVLGDLH